MQKEITFLQLVHKFWKEVKATMLHFHILNQSQTLSLMFIQGLILKLPLQ